MRLFNSSARKNALLVVFTVAVLGVVGYLFTGTGVQLPFLPSSEYRTSFETKDVDNLVSAAEVQVAGVQVGRVEEVQNQGDRARVEIAINSDAAPLHKGAKVRVGARSVVGESYIDITDGTGAEIPSGTALPASAVQPSVQVHDVLRSLDPRTRSSLSSLSRTLGDATKGSRQDVSKVLAGLGDLGREGHTAVDAISAQSEDLTALAAQTSSVLRAVNVGEGQVGTLVQNAQRITSATSGRAESLRKSVRQLPAVLDSASTATTKLRTLSSALGPVAADLKEASPHLNTALNQLPATTADLRGLLPSLDGTLGKAPATLERVPQLNTDVRGLIPGLRTTMSHLNPMLGYLEPYGRDLAAFFTNFRAILGPTDEAGVHYLRLQPIVTNLRVPSGVPVKLPEVLSGYNPYPGPGEMQNPKSNGQFTRLYPQPK